jgi:chromosome segregation ATPase
MSRWLATWNLLGVVALAALCVLQWQANRRVNLEASHLEQLRLEHLAKIAEQDKTLKGQAADLDQFREQLAHSSARLKETETQFGGAQKRLQQLESERDQLKSSVTQWAAAVTERDARLKQAGDQLQQFLKERNEAVTKFNELAARYNTIVKDLNDARARLAAAQTNAPPAP